MKKLHKIAIFIDPLKKLNHETDSSLYIYHLLEELNLDVYLFDQHSIYVAQTLVAQCFKITKDHQEYGHCALNLEIFDIILLRQEPPLDMQFLTNLHILRTLKHPKLLNNPDIIGMYPEKLLPFQFPQYMPRTHVAQNLEEIEFFSQQNPEFILKSLYGFGGQEVIKVKKTQIGTKAKAFLHRYTRVLMQEFLPEVSTGDKRILIINGEAVGVVRRVPEAGSILANIVQGGSAFIDFLTIKEEEIAREVGEWLYNKGVVLAGLDLINEKLIEVNITCPTIFKLHDNLCNKPVCGEAIKDMIRKILAQ